jgi:hypothetical protein
VRAVTESVALFLQRWLDDPEVSDALTRARGAIDELLWRRDIRAQAAAVSAFSRVRGAHDSAAMEGADIAAAENSPMGRVVAAAAAITGEVPALVDVWGKAPLQALARLHAVAAHEHLPAEKLGRPRVDNETADDPLSLGVAPQATAASQRLTLLADVASVSAEVPALLVAGIIHAELVSARPFAWGSGLLGRAAVRLVIASRGVDPSLFSIPESGMMNVGRPAYVRALRSYEEAEVDKYLIWFAQAVWSGAQSASTGVPGQS